MDNIHINVIIVVMPSQSLIYLDQWDCLGSEMCAILADFPPCSRLQNVNHPHKSAERLYKTDQSMRFSQPFKGTSNYQ